MRFDSIRELIRPAYNALGDLKTGYPEKRNILLKDKYNGKRCIILGTSRQLNSINFDKLKDEHTFACNFFHRHPQLRSMNLDFYAYIPPLNMLVRKAVDNNRNLPFFDLDDDSRNCSFKLFANASSKKYIEKKGLMKKSEIFYVKTKGPTLEGSAHFVDPTKRMHFMDGALYFMIAMTVYMGFTELYIFGAGYTQKPSQYLHFYDDGPEIKKEFYNSPPDLPFQPKQIIAEDFLKTHEVKAWNVLPAGCEAVYYSGISQKEFETEFSCAL
jgi:hypothetical protein